MMTLDALLAMAEGAVAAARRAGAEEAEAFACSSRGLAAEIEGGTLKSASSGVETAVGLRVLKDGRLGRASGPVGPPEPLARRAIAGALPAPEGFAFGEGAGATSRHEHPLPPVDDVVEETHRLLEAASGDGLTVTGGGVGYGTSRWALVTSRGLTFTATETGGDCSVGCVAEGEVAGVGHASAWTRGGRLDVEAAAHEAARHASETRDPRPLTDPPERIVFHPEALASLLGATLLPALSGARQARRESPLVTTEGPLAGEGVRAVDLGPRAGTRHVVDHDDEGTPYGPRDYLVDGGLAGAVATREDAVRYGLDTVGWAQRVHGLHGRGPHGDPSAGPGNLLVDGPRASVEEVRAEAGRALYVRDLIGAHTANATTGRFAVEATTAYLFEDGEPAGPVSGALVGGTLVGLLQGVLLASEPEVVPSWESPGLLLGEVLVERLPVTTRG